MSIVDALLPEGMLDAPANVVEDYTSRHAELADALPAWVPEALVALRARLPVSPTCRSFVSGRYFRPPGHKRCFYFRGDDGVIAFKGLEPLAPDFDELLDEMEHGMAPEWLSWGYPMQRRYAEHFALFENKPPCSSMLKEVVEQGRSAATLQLAHRAAYGGPARLPVPLLAHRFSDEQSAALLEKFRRHLSRRAYERIATLTQGALGAYVYFYGALPLRIKDYTTATPEADSHQSLVRLGEQLDVERLLERWIALYVRILYLGYLPAALQTKGQGNLLLSQNAILDGGFVDVDSLTPTRELDDPVFFDSLQFSHWVLFLTVRELLIKARTASWRWPLDYPDELILRYLDGKIRELLDSERSPTLTLDPRITDYFTATLSFGALRDKLASYFPAPVDRRTAPAFPHDLVIDWIAQQRRRDT